MTIYKDYHDILPTYANVLEAAERLKGVTVETPLLESPLLNDRIGGRLLVKPECLQVTGSFKFRGASNRIRALTAEERKGGVVAYSSGNHAQGVAAAAHLAGIPACIVMPADAPALKRASTEAWGAEVIAYDRFTEDRAAIATAEADRRGATLVPPFDDVHIVAGQGTVGLEIDRQLSAMGVEADQVLCCCGGGGLISGTALALKENRPSLPIYAVEPAGFDDTARALESGQIEGIDPDARSICDALLSPTPGRMTLSINSRLLAGGLIVSDEEALQAMGIAYQYLKLVAEPGGAVALAAALSGKIDITGKTTVAVISGGNVDAEMFARALATLS